MECMCGLEWPREVHSTQAEGGGSLGLGRLTLRAQSWSCRNHLPDSEITDFDSPRSLLKSQILYPGSVLRVDPKTGRKVALHEAESPERAGENCQYVLS
jgi:hypothetical protein